MTTRRAQGEGNWTKTTAGTWRLRIAISGARKDFYGKTKSEVLQKCEAYRRANATGVPISGTVTTGDYIQSWMKNVKFKQLKPTSYDRLESTVQKQIVERIGYTPLVRLSAPLIQADVINAMQEEGLSHSSIKKAYDALNAVCKYAVKDGTLSRNPVDIVEMPNIANFDKTEVRFFDAEEREKIRTACLEEYGTGTRRHKYASAFILNMYTGLRMGELLSLKWSSVDFDAKRITVLSTVEIIKDRENGGRKVVDIASTKTTRQRDVPLCDMAIWALNDIRRHLPYSKDGYVVCTDPYKPVSPSVFEKAFWRVLDRAGVERCGCHALRHTYATMMFERNVNIRIIADILGHSTTAVTSNIYIHIIERMKDKALTQYADIK